MDIFFKMIQNGGADQSPSSLEVGKMAQNATIDVNTVPTTISTSPSVPTSSDTGFLQKYGLIIGGSLLILIVIGTILFINNKNQSTSSSTVVTNVSSNKGTNQSTSSSNIMAVNNNKSVILQESTVNGETTTNFKKVDNGVVSTEATKEDLDKINAIRQQNINFAAQQQKSALDQSEQLKKMANLFH